MPHNPVLATIRRADGTEILVDSNFDETHLEPQSIEPSKPMKKSTAHGNQGFQKTVVQSPKSTLKEKKQKRNSRRAERQQREEKLDLMARGYAVIAAPETDPKLITETFEELRQGGLEFTAHEPMTDSYLEVDPWEAELDKEYEQTSTVASAIQSIQEAAVATSSKVAESATTAIMDALTPKPKAVTELVAKPATPSPQINQSRPAFPASNQPNSYVDVPEDLAAIDYLIIATFFVGLLLLIL